MVDIQRIDQNSFLTLLETETEDQIIKYYYICDLDSADLVLTTKLRRPEINRVNGHPYAHRDWDFFFSYDFGLQNIYNIVNSHIQSYAPEVAQLLTHQISLRQGTYSPVHFHVISEIYLHPNPEPIGFLVDVAIIALTL